MSTSHLPAVPDLAYQRARNNLWLKGRFESIFEKYERDFDTLGDEIDLETGEIAIDNGHLRTMRNDYDVVGERIILEETSGDELELDSSQLSVSMSLPPSSQNKLHGQNGISNSSSPLALDPSSRKVPEQFPRSRVNAHEDLGKKRSVNCSLDVHRETISRSTLGGVVTPASLPDDVTSPKSNHQTRPKSVPSTLSKPNSLRTSSVAFSTWQTSNSSPYSRDQQPIARASIAINPNIDPRWFAPSLPQDASEPKVAILPNQRLSSPTLSVAGKAFRSIWAPEDSPPPKHGVEAVKGIEGTHPKRFIRWSKAEEELLQYMKLQTKMSRAQMLAMLPGRSLPSIDWHIKRIKQVAGPKNVAETPQTVEKGLRSSPTNHRGASLTPSTSDNSGGDGDDELSFPNRILSVIDPVKATGPDLSLSQLQSNDATPTYAIAVPDVSRLSEEMIVSEITRNEDEKELPGDVLGTDDIYLPEVMVTDSQELSDVLSSVIASTQQQHEPIRYSQTALIPSESMPNQEESDLPDLEQVRNIDSRPTEDLSIFDIPDSEPETPILESPSKKRKRIAMSRGEPATPSRPERPKLRKEDEKDRQKPGSQPKRTLVSLPLPEHVPSNRRGRPRRIRQIVLNSDSSIPSPDAVKPHDEYTTVESDLNNQSPREEVTGEGAAADAGEPPGRPKMNDSNMLTPSTMEKTPPAISPLKSRLNALRDDGSDDELSTPEKALFGGSAKKQQIVRRSTLQLAEYEDDDLI
ncbi:hypothetical protein MMC25_000012 [Agyrium rufum]|nr:hypothetical protein [Agyrium rufum]